MIRNAGNSRRFRWHDLKQRQLGHIAFIFIFIASMVPAGAQSIQPFYQSAQFSVSADQVIEGPYRAQAISPTEIVSNYPMHNEGAEQERKWVLNADLSAFPAFHSDFPLIDAVYNL